MSDETKPSTTFDPNERVIIILKFNNMEPLTMKVKMKTNWTKIIATFGKSRGLDTDKLRFLFDGN